MGHNLSQDVVFVTAKCTKAPILEEGLISACRAPRSLDLQPRGSQRLAQQVQPQPCLPPPLCNAGTEPWLTNRGPHPALEGKFLANLCPIPVSPYPGPAAGRQGGRSWQCHQLSLGRENPRFSFSQCVNDFHNINGRRCQHRTGSHPLFAEGSPAFLQAVVFLQWICFSYI